MCARSTVLLPLAGGPGLRLKQVHFPFLPRQCPTTISFPSTPNKTHTQALLSLVVLASEVVELTDANFEHLTQASTGATTGDWFVAFSAPW